MRKFPAEISRSVLSHTRSVPPAYHGTTCKVEKGSRWYKHLLPLHRYLQEFPNATSDMVRAEMACGRLQEERVYRYWFGDVERAIQLARDLVAVARPDAQR